SMHQFMQVYALVQVSQGNLAPAQQGYAPAQNTLWMFPDFICTGS
ncbi:hypothetical protein A2U01_0083575, partial [Trifolium medium]|nr:hypothetical protein [Trifolium medium]